MVPLAQATFHHQQCEALAGWCVGLVDVADLQRHVANIAEARAGLIAEGWLKATAADAAAADGVIPEASWKKETVSVSSQLPAEAQQEGI